jgi:hypothetical protein
MVNDPLHSTVVKLTRSAFAGKPFTVSEVNHPNPNEYGCEMIPLLAAYGAFQDWDGIFLYTFEPKISSWQEFVTDPFDITLDPVKMIQMQAGALLFLRPDVRPAMKVVQRSYSTEQINESMRLPEADGRTSRRDFLCHCRCATVRASNAWTVSRPRSSGRTTSSHLSPTLANSNGMSPARVMVW